MRLYMKAGGLSWEYLATQLTASKVQHFISCYDNILDTSFTGEKENLIIVMVLCH